MSFQPFASNPRLDAPIRRFVDLASRGRDATLRGLGSYREGRGLKPLGVEGPTQTRPWARIRRGLGSQTHLSCWFPEHLGRMTPVRSKSPKSTTAGCHKAWRRWPLRTALRDGANTANTARARAVRHEEWLVGKDDPLRYV